MPVYIPTSDLNLHDLFVQKFNTITSDQLASISPIIPLNEKKIHTEILDMMPLYGRDSVIRVYGQKFTQPSRFKSQLVFFSKDKYFIIRLRQAHEQIGYHIEYSFYNESQISFDLPVSGIIDSTRALDDICTQYLNLMDPMACIEPYKHIKPLKLV